MAKKVVVYGTMECPDTVEAIELLNKEGIRHAYIDILKSMGYLKRFLNIRDANPDLYADTVANRGIGVPTIVVDGEVYNGMDKPDLSLLK